VEHWQRFFAKDSGQHPAPFWYFIPVIIGGLMPWTLLLPGIFTKVKLKLPQDSFTRYCWCWLVLPFLFFSASSGKLGTYILPCFPAAAFLLASGIKIYFEQKDRNIFNRTAKIMAIILFTVLGLFIISQTAAELNIPQRLIEEIFHKKVSAVSLYGSGETWKWLTLAGILAFWGYSMLKANRSIKSSNKILWFCTGPLIAFLMAHPLCPWLVEKRKAPGPFLTQVAGHVKSDDIVVCGNHLFAAASWYFRRDDLLVYRKGGELQYGLDKPEAYGRFLTEEAFAELVNNQKRKQRVVLIINSRHWPRQVPEPQFKIFEPDQERILFVIYN
jgi:4-amino-4-deoxy-L-arabinose transferase